MTLDDIAVAQEAYLAAEAAYFTASRRRARSIVAANAAGVPTRDIAAALGISLHSAQALIRRTRQLFAAA